MIAPRISVTRKSIVEASRNASRRSPFSSNSVKTGTNAAWMAASANRLRTRFGTWNAIVNADIGPSVPKYEAATISRTRPATREAAVASENSAVERARRPERGRAGSTSSLGVGLGGRNGVGLDFPGGFRPFVHSLQVRAAIIRAREMANIASQRKRNARSLREQRRESPLQERRQDALQAPRSRGRRRRRERGRQRAPRVDLEDRQGRSEGRSAPPKRRPQEGSRGTNSRWRFLLGSRRLRLTRRACRRREPPPGRAQRRRDSRSPPASTTRGRRPRRWPLAARPGWCFAPGAPASSPRTGASEGDDSSSFPERPASRPAIASLASRSRFAAW